MIPEKRIIMEQWLVSMKKADFNKIAKQFNISPVTARLIRNRNYIDISDINKYLNGGLSDLYPASLMKDIERASEILLNKIKSNKTIRIIGDYDIDGIMSTYILLKGLSRLGADVDERIPERIRDGYGLNENLVKEAFDDGKDTIITCDNGIAAYNQVALAKSLGLTVIVTDHHEVPYNTETNEQIIPPADAVVDPKQRSCSYPFKELCGAAIAWKLISCLYTREGISIDEANSFIEFVSIATIGDVCDLRDENRIIVKEGLNAIKHCSNYGLNALISLNKLNINNLNTYHIGFIIGPCLNASGRLETAQKALSLLNCDSDSKALSIASELISLNISRKSLTEQFTAEAINQIESSNLLNDKVIVVYLPKCHESLAGIIAGRIKERYNKPSFVITDSEGLAKGSGRSIEEFSMFEEMTKCKELFTKFGGHPMAAGLSLKKENIDKFRSIINKNCSLTDEDLIPKLHIDMQMPINYITKELIYDIDKLKPFGKGNTKPIFVQKGLNVLHPRIVGSGKNAVKMQLSDGYDHFINAVYFGDAEKFIQCVNSNKTISAVYYPDINEYKGYQSLQLTITSYR